MACGARKVRKASQITLLLIAAAGMAIWGPGCKEEDIERTLGKQTATAVEKEYGVSQDPILSSWINTLGQRLVGQSPRQHLSYRFRVVNTDMINAFAAPWGYIYITRGMLRFARSEDEIAFVLGHEIAHVAHRDAIKSFKNTILFNLGVALLGQKNETWGNISGIAASLLMLSYSRADEKEADSAACTYVYSAGYDPAAGLTFFERLYKEVEKEHPSSIEHIFLTHPPTSKRIADVKKRPELNVNDPLVASRLGRCYARRYAYAMAATFYKTALGKKPEAYQTRLAYADALRALGYSEQALEQYQMALQQQQGNMYIQQAIAALQNSPNAFSSSSPDEPHETASLLATATSQEAKLALLQANVQNYQATMRTPLKNLSGNIRGSIYELYRISNQEGNLPAAGHDVFLEATSAVNAASETAFALETIHQTVKHTTEQLQINLSRLKTALQQFHEGAMASVRLSACQRALREMDFAEQILSHNMGQTSAAQPFVVVASQAARDTVSMINSMISAAEAKRYLLAVKASALETATKAAQAAEAIREAKQTALMAEASTLIAKLNVLYATASPAQQQAYAGLIAYFSQTTPQQIQALCARGFGWGDAAFIAMAAQARGNAPASIADKAPKADSLVEFAHKEGIPLTGPVALLRFISNMLEQEMEAQKQL